MMLLHIVGLHALGVEDGWGFMEVLLFGFGFLRFGQLGLGVRVVEFRAHLVMRDCAIDFAWTVA